MNSVQPRSDMEPLGGAERVETVDRVFEAFARRDLDGVLEFLHPQVRLWVVTSTVTRDGRPYVGHAGIREYFADATRIWRELELLPVRFEAVDEAVIVVGEVHARGPAGELRQPAVWSWKFRDGLVIDCRVDSDVTAAREALGDATATEELLRAYVAAFNERHPEEMIALSDPSIVNYPTAISHGSRRGYVGHRGLRTWIDDVLTNDPGHTIRVRSIQKIEADRWAVLGELFIDRLPVSPFASLIEVSAGGMITEVREYLSEESLLRELGHLPSAAV
jgi:ketosteroid isomerase-like protein